MPQPNVADEQAVANRLRHRAPLRDDFDSTVDPTHGEQQLTLFNGFYDTWCYLPLLGFISIDDKPAQQHRGRPCVDRRSLVEVHVCAQIK